MSGNASKTNGASRRAFTTNNPNELTIQNSALVLIDHQPGVGLAVHSMDQGVLISNVAVVSVPDFMSAPVPA